MTAPRHPWLGRIVPALDSLIAAAELDPAAPDEARVWRVPAFTWAPGTGRHGRKGRGRLMPFRAHWEVLSDSPSTRTGRAIGPGLALEIEATPECVTPARLRREATGARWELFTELSHWAPRAVASAHAVRSAEVARNMQRADLPLLDGPALEAVADELMLAPGGFFERMLALVVRPSCFDRVDPQMWISRMLRREADQAVGRAIGDVLPGPQIRRLYAELRDKPAGLSEIVALYNSGISRSNRIGPARATRALLVGSITPAARLSGDQDAAVSAPSAEDTYLLGAAP